MTWSSLTLFLYLLSAWFASPIVSAASAPQIDPAYDCAFRQLAVDFARALQQPSMTADWGGLVSSALEFNVRCNSTGQATPSQLFALPPSHPFNIRTSPVCDWTVYTAVDGFDVNPGSLQSPVQSLRRAVQLSRSRPFNSTSPCVLMRGGTYWMGGQFARSFGSKQEAQLGVVQLTSEDSGLTISAYQGESVVLSGGVELNVTWSLYKQTERGPIMKAVIPDSVVGDWRHFNELFVLGAATSPEPHWRAIRARYPNADPAIEGLHTRNTGWITSAHSWVPPAHPREATEVHVLSPNRTHSGFPQWQTGIGGQGTYFEGNTTFWAMANPPAGGGATYVVPRGVIYNVTSFSPRVSQWTQPTTGHIHAIHQHEWGSWIFDIASVDTKTQTVMFGAGGQQEGRGAPAGKEYYVDNIMEELDAPLEWFLARDTRTLYFMPNGSMPATFVASQVPCLISMRGDAVAPVTNVTITGLTFSHTAVTYMESYEIPSAGDWAVARGATVFLSGTQSVSLLHNEFTMIGAPALFVADFNADLEIGVNHFAWLGDSAITMVGQSSGIDGVSNLNQPTRVHIYGNLIRELGHYAKETGAIFQALTRSSLIEGNAAFNAPRALVNFNDGFAGGSIMRANLLFNAVRETGDHGPFNSWDRQPYLTLQPNCSASQPSDSHSQVKQQSCPLTPSLTSAVNELAYNLVFSEYSSGWVLDHDDGSSYYDDHHNVLLYGGSKYSGGNGKHFHNNLLLFPDWNGRTTPRKDTKSVNPSNAAFCVLAYVSAHPTSNYDDTFVNNTCVLSQNSQLFGISDQCEPLSNGRPHFANNTYALFGSDEAWVPCTVNGKVINASFTVWQNLSGEDQGSRVTHGPVPVADLVTAARSLLCLTTTELDMEGHRTERLRRAPVNSSPQRSASDSSADPIGATLERSDADQGRTPTTFNWTMRMQH